MIRRSHAPASEAQRQLLELGISQRTLGAAVGVSHQTAHRWIAGIKAPRPEHQQKIAEVFGIEPRNWELAPRPEVDPPTTLAGDLLRKLEAEREANRAAEVAASRLPDNAAALDELLAQVRRARAVENVAPTVLARLGSIEVSAITAREKLRSAVEIAQNSEEWKAHYDRLHATALEALRAHPLAFLELIAAMAWGLPEATAAATEAREALAAFEVDHAAEVAAVRDSNSKLVEAMRARAERITARRAA